MLIDFSDHHGCNALYGCTTASISFLHRSRSIAPLSAIPFINFSIPLSSLLSPSSLTMQLSTPRFPLSLAFYPDILTRVSSWIKVNATSLRPSTTIPPPLSSHVAHAAHRCTLSITPLLSSPSHCISHCPLGSCTMHDCSPLSLIHHHHHRAMFLLIMISIDHSRSVIAWRTHALCTSNSSHHVLTANYAHAIQTINIYCNSMRAAANASLSAVLKW